MMRKNVLLFVLMLMGGFSINAQVMFKTEYLGRSSYRVSEGETNRKVGNSKGSAMVFQGGVNIPLSVKLDTNNRPTSWTVYVGGAYAKLYNKNFTEPLVIDEILNIGVGLNHIRPLNERWSLMASIGTGIYMPGTDFSQLRFKNVLGSVGVVFIRHLKPNLDLGGGLALNNSFGYPMVFPAFYLNWRTGSKYDVKVTVIRGLEVSVGYDVNKKIRLHYVAEMNGQMALLEQDGKDKIFSHVYLVTGFRPEFKVGKNVSLSVTAGLNVWRPSEMTDRKLKSIFKDREYYFQASPYASAGLKVGL